MELFTYLMAKNGHNTSVKKDLFSYLLGKNQSGTYTEFTGTSISANNTKKGKMKVNLLGNTSQTGTPTPDSPIPVNVVSGDNTINVTGKNLLNYADLSNQQYITIEGEYITITNDSGSAIYPTITYVTPLEATNYTSKIDVKSITAGKTLFIYLQENSSDYSAGHTITLNSVTEKVVTQTFSDTMKKYMLVVSAGTTVKLRAMLVKGTYTSETIGDYASYTSTSYPIHLGEYELCKIGDYQDKFFKNIPNTTDYKSDLEDNEWYLEKKIGKHTFTENDDFAIESQNTDRTVFQSPFIDNIYIGGTTSDEPLLLTTKFIPVSQAAHWVSGNISKAPTGLRVYIIIGANKTTTDLHSIIDDEPLYYVLSTPTYTPITGTLKDELEAVWRANSYKGTTNISQINNDLPFNLDVEIKVGN